MSALSAVVERLVPDAAARVALCSALLVSLILGLVLWIEWQVRRRMAGAERAELAGPARRRPVRVPPPL